MIQFNIQIIIKICFLFVYKIITKKNIKKFKKKKKI